jgi:hypothetical protein
MRKIILILIFFCNSVSFSPAIFLADELFGCGQAVLISSYPPTGIIISELGTWAIYGDKSSCRLRQIAGREVGDYDESGLYIKTETPCYIEPVKNNPSKFRGLIYFRGHTRKFCGGINGNPPPAQCKLPDPLNLEP